MDNVRMMAQHRQVQILRQERSVFSWNGMVPKTAIINQIQKRQRWSRDSRSREEGRKEGRRYSHTRTTKRQAERGEPGGGEEGICSKRKNLLLCTSFVGKLYMLHHIVLCNRRSGSLNSTNKVVVGTAEDVAIAGKASAVYTLVALQEEAEKSERDSVGVQWRFKQFIRRNIGPCLLYRASISRRARCKLMLSTRWIRINNRNDHLSRQQKEISKFDS